jgi:YfiR/HmsC-like
VSRLPARCFLTATLVSIWICGGIGQTLVTRQEDIKATFLYTFGKFVEWPANSFDQAVVSFRIEIVGRDPFNGRLDQLMIGKKLHDRPVEVVHSLDETSRTPVHVAFVSASETRRVDALLNDYRPRHVLTVSDMTGFTRRGGMIGGRAIATAGKFQVAHARSLPAGRGPLRRDAHICLASSDLLPQRNVWRKPFRDS